MDMEARSFSQEKSQQLMRKVKEYKADLKKITEDSKQAQGSGSGSFISAAGYPRKDIHDALHPHEALSNLGTAWCQFLMVYQ